MYLLLMVNTFFKYAVQPWAPEWRHATLIFSWLNYKKTLASYPYKPLAYYRYIGDIFIIWSHGLDLLHNFINSIKKQHSSIIFTSNISITSINFLDVAIDLDRGRISTKTYAKSQGHTHILHTNVSTLDMSNNLLSSVNF